MASLIVASAAPRAIARRPALAEGSGLWEHSRGAPRRPTRDFVWLGWGLGGVGWLGIQVVEGLVGSWEGRGIIFGGDCELGSTGLTPVLAC